jgi:hypothetical protein
MSHFLAVNHESYDGDTLFGIFDTFSAARDYLESDAAKQVSSSAIYAEVEEWDGATWICTYERWGLNWRERGADRRGE